MAANYWVSSQREHWLVTRDELAEARAECQVHVESLPDPRLADEGHMRIFIASLAASLGRRLDLRQQTVATAQVYLARFYTRAHLRETNPYLIVAACIYLAAKADECPQHIRTILSEARTLWPDGITHDASKLAEAEFYITEELGSYLIVYHPYTSLFQLLPYLKLSAEGEPPQYPTTSSAKAIGGGTRFMEAARQASSSMPNNGATGLTPDEMQTAWAVIADSYSTDLPLLYPPHVIAITAIYMAVVLQFPQMTFGGPQDLAAGSRNARLVDWIACSTIDLDQIIDCTQEIINLSQLYESYNEKACREAVDRILGNSR